MFRVAVVYPATEGGHFDFEYYVKSHVPKAVSFISASVIRTEVTKGVGGAGGGPAPYTAIGTIYLRDLECLQALERPEVMTWMVGDLPNFTNISPVVSVEEVVAA